jgi:uncharacterized protein Yka (UPF0111/DUF47 family)
MPDSQPYEVFMFASLLPKPAPFFEMLLAQNTLLRRAAELLLAMLETPSEQERSHKEMALLEEEADQLYARIVRSLSQTFITPIDREDILRINQVQEEAIDCLQSLSTRLSIFEFPRVRFPALQMVRTIVSLLALTKLMLEGLSSRRDCHKTRAFKALRGECDMLLSTGLAELMDEKQEFTPLLVMRILKWSQIYERLGVLVERSTALAETIEEAVLKNV